MILGTPGGPVFSQKKHSMERGILKLQPVPAGAFRPHFPAFSLDGKSTKEMHLEWVHRERNSPGSQFPVPWLCLKGSWLGKQMESNPSAAASVKRKEKSGWKSTQCSQNWNSNFSSQPCQQPRELHLLPNPAWSQLANPTFLLHGQVPGLKIFPEMTLSLAASGKAGNCSGTRPGEEQSRGFSGIAGLWRAANPGFSLLLDHFN